MRHPRPIGTPAAGCVGVRADEVLPLQEFCRRLNIGRKTWYGMRDAGLRAVAIGKQRYILGRDALGFFDRLAEQQAGEEAS